jgi:hypothetical protein
MAMSKQKDGGPKKPTNKSGVSKEDWKAMSSASKKKGTNLISDADIKAYKKSRVSKEDWSKMSSDSKKRGTNLISYGQIRETRASKAIGKSAPAKKLSVKNQNFMGGKTTIK